MLRVTRTAGAHLAPAQIDAIWRFSQRFVRRRRDEFVGKLRAAERVILYRERGAVLGMVALDTVHTRICDQPAMALHVRWAMLDRSIRRRGLLVRVLTRAWIAARLRHPRQPIFIIFAAATWRSYLAAVNAIPQCWPRPGAETPPSIAQMASVAMRQLAGDDWRDNVLLGRGQWQYQEGVIGEVEQPDGAVTDLYAQLNPHQAAGDAPLCVIPTGWRIAVHAFHHGRRQRRLRAEKVAS